MYAIKKIKKRIKIENLNLKEGFLFKPNISNKNFISIKELYLYNDEDINIIVKKKLDKEIRRLTLITMSVLNDDDTTEGDALIALDDVERIKKIILKYQDYIIKEDLKNNLKKIKIFEKALKEKQKLLSSESRAR